jgi:hypothetical protein
MQSNKPIARRWKRSDDWGIDSEWSGTAMIYAASNTSSFALSGDYQVSFEDESEPEDSTRPRTAVLRVHPVCS